MDGANGVRELLESLAEIKSMDAGQATTLPPQFYTSEKFLQLEKEEIFRKEWICLGRAEQIPNPGDYFATDLLEEPLIVVRSQDKKIRVLSNVCRHRSSVIVENDGNAKHFVCPYHVWTYRNDGQLLRAPYMDQVKGVEVEKCKLPEFAAEIWRGFIYVNLDGKATPLAPRLAGLEPYIRNQHPEEMHFQYGTEQIWTTNWKCLAENFLEGYHLSTLHYNTLHKRTPTRLCEKLPGGEGYTSFKSHYDPNFQPQMPCHPDVTDEERRYSVLFCIYPSLVVSVAARRTVYLHFYPRTVDQLVTRLGFATVTKNPSSKTLKAMRNSRVNEEDQEQMERQLSGFKSRYVEPSSLGPPDLEGTVWDIFQYVARKLVPGEIQRPRLRRAS